MSERNEISDRLAEALKAARSEKGLSLEAVANLSGVSKSMVSQIERGQSSPTVATLWNLTQALQVDFAGLVGSSAQVDEITCLRAGTTPTIDGRGEGCRIRILSPPEEAGRHEVYELLFEAGGRLVSDAHGVGAREHLTVIEGSLEVVSGEAVEVLSAGDTAHYNADRSHRIVAKGGAARGFLVVRNG